MRLSWSSGEAMQEREIIRFTDCRPIRGAGPGATEVDEFHNFREQRYHLGEEEDALPHLPGRPG